MKIIAMSAIQAAAYHTLRAVRAENRAERAEAERDQALRDAEALRRENGTLRATIREHEAEHAEELRGQRVIVPDNVVVLWGWEGGR